MPLIKEIEDALKLVAELPKVQQEVAAILLRNLVVFHEEETTMTKEQLEALRKVRAEFVCSERFLFFRAQLCEMDCTIVVLLAA